MGAQGTECFDSDVMQLVLAVAPGVLISLLVSPPTTSPRILKDYWKTLCLKKQDKTKQNKKPQNRKAHLPTFNLPLPADPCAAERALDKRCLVVEVGTLSLDGRRNSSVPQA